MDEPRSVSMEEQKRSRGSISRRSTSSMMEESIADMDEV